MKVMSEPFHLLFRAIFMCMLSFCYFLSPTPTARAQGEAKTYVGTEICKGCHEKEHTRFTTHSKMSTSFKTITRMKKRLTAEELKKCYECHTTGYGKPGGFKSEAETPDLKNLGCETCHGPGSGHASSSDPKDIKGRLDTKDCESCHAKDRIAAFKYKPVLFGGAH